MILRANIHCSLTLGWKILHDKDDIGRASTYFFTEIFPSLSTCIQSFVWAFCRKFVAEPLSWKRLYANFISSSVQCCKWNEKREKKNQKHFITFSILCDFVFMIFKCILSVLTLNSMNSKRSIGSLRKTEKRCCVFLALSFKNPLFSN